MNENYLMDKEIIQIYMKKKLAIILTIISAILLFCQNYVLVLISALLLIACIVFIIILEKKRVSIDNGQVSDKFERINKISNSLRFYEILSYNSVDSNKQSNYVGTKLSMTNCKVSRKTPFPFIKTNGVLFSNKKYKCKVWFNENNIIIFKGFKLYQIDYDNIKMIAVPTKLIEHNSVPKDTEIIGKHWLYSNADGSPDKRHKDNKQLPVCKYGELIIDLDNNTKLIYYYSNGNL